MKELPPTEFRTPRESDLDLVRIANRAGFSFSCLPNGAIFAMEHERDGRSILINQVLASPLSGGIGRIYLRIGAPKPKILQITGASALCLWGVDDDRFAWSGETSGYLHQVVLWLHPDKNLWLWRVGVTNKDRETAECDAVLIQDLGLGERSFVMANEAFASQYIDHHVASHGRLGSVLMSRQNLAQDGRHPWIAHGCLDRSVGFATDLRQVMGSAYRDADFDCHFGTDLPSIRLQHEAACAALQSSTARLEPGACATWTFFGVYQPHHPSASTDADLAIVEDAEHALQLLGPKEVFFRFPVQTLLQHAPPLVSERLDERLTNERWPQRTELEFLGTELLSFFAPSESHSRHVVLREKERIVTRRHGALLRSGNDMLPSESTLCTTLWMHGVFAAQLTIGNTSFHKLFSVSRDPYNIIRASGLRILVDRGDGWRLLTVPSAFDMGFSDCRWIYRIEGRTIEVTVAVAGQEPAMCLKLMVDGLPCRFLLFGHLVLGEREFENAGRVEIDPNRKEFTFRPDPDGLWSQHYPHATFRLVTDMPDGVEAVGGDELLYCDGKRRGGAFAAIRTHPIMELTLTVVGSMTDANAAESLAAKYSQEGGGAAMLESSHQFWRTVTRGLEIRSSATDPDASAINTVFPWFVHDAMVHLTVPHGLEQYTGAAWGTRDVCQGPVEFFLALEHDEPVKEIMRIVFAQQYEDRSDWPQWFMHEPYSSVQDRNAHGDVVIWPLKALCDYVEATGDFSALGEQVAWRRESNLEKTPQTDSITRHVEKLIANLCQQFIPGTHLIRYGNGDWNDSLQPVDPVLRDWMTSSWTVALLYQQLRRYAEILRRTNQPESARQQEALAAAVREDFNHFLVHDGTVAGYGVFATDGHLRELLFHPSDRRTGISYSLLPMTQGILGGLFTPEQVQHHLALIRRFLTFPDGVRLMDKPVAYRGGPEAIFRRAESSAFFGREIGLMYVHAHLRYAEAMAVLHDSEAFREALVLANPIAVTKHLAHASLRQRNTYFTSSDAAFPDRYRASEEWDRVRTGTIPVEGGWRVYSSGPGLFISLFVRYVLGIRRYFGKRISDPLSRFQ